MRISILPLALAAAALSACSYSPTDERGVDRGETLLSVSASGQADSTPDEAEFQAGVESFGRSGQAASAANADKIAELVQGLRVAGVAEDDIQTSTVGIQRIEWGDRKGQYQASNIVTVTVRDVGKAGDAVTAASTAGANIMRGPDLRMSDPEAAANSAYTAAYKAARARAQAYADAADMEVSRVLYIRDAGGVQGGRYFQGAQALEIGVESEPPPPPVITPMPEERTTSAGAIMPGRTVSSVTVQVDFALRPK